ncbi:DNA-directed RNA polymerase subunit Rpb10/RpoN [Tetraselmis virus 1]|uniref:DNA-directed RNA polymerase subunit Rpb10/RpoN n=1 Tax=Tetraselmis virus 1 TaxID=2060617 RepID=A0A2P0VMW1_9VIRU|nr:DNA-directed RNA polymerase subunit Rpb10/RpoN [Tetraselmis virus 1]AUF82248.1 DNA-directed RNA polymerase subunit Rpb10/RpoN [Tetraselmis virus 1]
MIIPIRCMTCGKMIADKWRVYEEKTAEIEDKKKEDMVSKEKAMDDLGLVRYCCRRHFLGQVDLIEKI